MREKIIKNPTTIEEAIEYGKILSKYMAKNLVKLDEKWRANRTVMEALIDYRVNAFQFASEEIRSDKALALKVVEVNPSMFKYVAGGLNADLEVFTTALEHAHNGSLLFAHVDKSILNNRDFILKYISKYPTILEYVSDELKDDKTIVKMAVDSNGNALEYASMRFRDDKDFVLNLINKKSTYKDDQGRDRIDTKNLLLIQHASDRLRSDPEIVNNLIKREIFTYRCFSEKVRSNKQFALAILKKQGILIDSVAPNLTEDKEVVLTAVKNYGLALEYASEELKSDKEVVLTAIKNNGRALSFASQELRSNIKFINSAFKNGPFIIEPVAFKVYNRIESNSKNPLIAKFNDGKANADEVLELQDWLLRQATESDKLKPFEDEDAVTLED